ncbi:hypothetical protein N7E02_07910 (plasmid) [Aliirhizobium terrae]|nr:hypothetical protein [Rhizobium sp. CC-CFT758]WJH38515.1 hypothetical protein N7E02_07910 [Rhizobium sp. CC-CFT758]
MTESKNSSGSDAARTEEGQADENRKVLKQKAEEGLKNADDELPKDQI